MAVTTVLFAALSIVLGAIVRDGQLQTYKSRQYPLLASRLFVENPSDSIVNLQPLRAQVTDYLNAIGTPYSFYFEYLFTGSSIRAGDENQLVGASLMKIPIVMDLYKAVEKDKTSLDNEVTVPEDVPNSNDPNYGNTSRLKPGQKISLRKAAEITLKESDNTAAYTLFNAIKDMLEPNDQALNNLDIEIGTSDSDKGKVALISARSYTSILKCLYFSCFLNVDDSQEILKYLSESVDNNRLRAGVPANVSVARKIGSFSTITQSDCGIVYIPDRRYTFCVMLHEDEKSADSHIKELSKMVYEYIVSLKSAN